MECVNGTFECPLCGTGYPHDHTGEEIAIYNGARSPELELKALKAAIGAVESLANHYIDKGLDGRKEYPLYGVVLRAIKNRLVSESPLPGREPQDGNRTLECNNCGRSVPVGGVIKAGTTCSIWLGGNNYCHGKFSPVLKPAPQLPVRPEDEDSDVIIPGNEYRALLHDQAGYRALLEVLEDLRKFTAPPKAGK